ncbi:Hsp20/alpha crystallin family protein [Chitinimonas sp.]|uniref:Hsp20/alpha crystallin family protein n=1 Tax=Chitinimonas sp. TaxID=1934313 RepID=UPI002F95DDCD
MNRVHDWKEGLSQFWASLNNGWAKLKERAAGALTYYSPDSRDAVPRQADGSRLGVASWAYLAVDVYDEGGKLIVRVEAPGMEKEDFSYVVQGNMLTVSGAKRFERSANLKQYRILECAYGSFQRMVPLPVAVDVDKAEAAYRDGVLRIAFPKLASSTARRIEVRQG